MRVSITENVLDRLYRKEVGMIGRRKKESSLPHLPLNLLRVGVGTRLQLGCQDIFGPNPSVLLDKALRR